MGFFYKTFYKKYQPNTTLFIWNIPEKLQSHLENKMNLQPFFKKQNKKLKYKNIRIGKYASKKEAKRGASLKLLEKKGVISHLKVHPRYKIKVANLHITDYVADFEYIDSNGEKIVEDVKGMRSGLPYQMFQIKKRLMQAVNNIVVTEFI